MSKTTETPDLYRVEAETVVASVACSFCGVDVDSPCENRTRHSPPSHPHAQRWWDYWNATHGSDQQIPVYTRMGRRA